MNKDFKIIKKVKAYILFLEKVLKNFPKKDYIARNIIYETSLDILYLVIKANYCEDLLERKEYQKEILILIHMLDFYLERGFYFHHLNEETLKVNSEKLTEITKMIYGWIKSAKVSKL